MRYCTVRADGKQTRTGILTEEGYLRLLPAHFQDIADLAESGSTPSKLASLAGPSAGRLEDFELMAPVQRFSKNVLCTGWNYLAHFEEGIGKRTAVITQMPDAPTFFTKAPGAIAPPSGTLPIDLRLSSSWDYEAEIAVVIGRTGRSISQSQAKDYIFGYCLANDVSQRSLQRRHGGQWFRGKTVDRSTPLGPFVISADAVELGNVTLECRVNGETRQHASASQMAFPVERLIAELSLGMTLNAGDVILTGTPAGVGMGMEPPVYLQPGDVVETRSNLLGAMRHQMAETDLVGSSEMLQ